MARNDIVIDAPPERVFAVLSDADSYGHWVVGSRNVRDADPGFPAAGTRFHHAVGAGPLRVKDHTEVLECSPPQRLALRAKARPLGSAHVELELEPHGTGTRVVMVEHLVGVWGKLVPRIASDPLIGVRNREALRRLKRLAERPS